MKRIPLLVLLFSLLLSTPAYALEPLSEEAVPISAPSAILMEKTTGTVLYEKNADERRLPASVTKVMTMLLIVEDLETGRLHREDVVTASARAASFGGSCVYLEEGEQMSVHEMLKCIAVVSANDCAVAMAEHISGSEALFVERMNRRADELGLKNTHFTNCTGLFEDPEHYTSARDIALMSRELISHELIKEYSTIWIDSIRDGAFQLSNTNKLVRWYEGCTGLKTGYTSAAMYCLAATAERDGVEYIAVILHGDSIDSRNSDATTLLNLGFANYTLCPLLPDGGLPELPVDMGRSPAVQLRLEGGEYALIPKSGSPTDCQLELPPSVSAPIRQGQKLGTLTLRLGDEIAARRDLLAAEDVARLGFGDLFVRLLGSLVGQ